MNQFILLAEPLWVNLLILIPVVVFFLFRSNKLLITRKQLLFAAIFGIAFGFVESSVVVYLRAALGFLPGYMGTLSDVIQQSGNVYQQVELLSNLPNSLFTIELFREVATIVMLIMIALLSVKKFKERCAVFLWVFAFWDIFYYVGLWLTTRWPSSLTTPDILFLIPTPWISQIWFPCLVSVLTIVAIAINTKNRNLSQ